MFIGTNGAEKGAVNVADIDLVTKTLVFPYQDSKRKISDMEDTVFLLTVSEEVDVAVRLKRSTDIVVQERRSGNVGGTVKVYIHPDS